MNNRTPASDLLDNIRQIGACAHATIDAATLPLSDREKAILASQLTKVAAHIATRVGSSRGLPPPGTLPGVGSDRLDLSAQRNALRVAQLFTRNVLFKWGWTDVQVDGERAVHELTKAFVTAIEDNELDYPTRMTVRLRAASANRLVVELHDSAENAHIIARSGRLISDCVERISVRCGQHNSGGRTVLWCELARPEFSRWQ